MGDSNLLRDAGDVRSVDLQDKLQWVRSTGSCSCSTHFLSNLKTLSEAPPELRRSRYLQGRLGIYEDLRGEPVAVGFPRSTVMIDILQEQGWG